MRTAREKQGTGNWPNSVLLGGDFFVVMDQDDKRLKKEAGKTMGNLIT